MPPSKKSRVQMSTVSYLTYFEARCRKVHAKMTEVDKVMKEIADDVFNLIVFKGFSTANEIITECRRFEYAKSRRVTDYSARIPNTIATSTCGDGRMATPPSTSEVFVRIVRHESKPHRQHT